MHRLNNKNENNVIVTTAATTIFTLTIIVVALSMITTPVEATATTTTATSNTTTTTSPTKYYIFFTIRNRVVSKSYPTRADKDDKPNSNKPDTSEHNILREWHIDRSKYYRDDQYHSQR